MARTLLVYQEAGFGRVDLHIHKIYKHALKIKDANV